MAKIDLPKDMLEIAALKSLPPKEKEEYINNLLKQILDINTGGVTISQIKEATGMPSSTIWHHLEILKSVALSRKISHGNSDIYYAYGKEQNLNDYEKGMARYSISTLENEEGKFVCIRDKRKNRLDSYIIVRGVAIPLELIDNFIQALTEINNSIKNK